jgi:hypothetical protein
MESATEPKSAIQQFVIDNPFPSFHEMSQLIGHEYAILGLKNHNYVKIIYDYPDDPIIMHSMAKCMFHENNKKSFTTNFNALMFVSPCSSSSNNEIRTHFAILKTIFHL